MDQVRKLLSSDRSYCSYNGLLYIQGSGSCHWQTDRLTDINSWASCDAKKLSTLNFMFTYTNTQNLKKVACGVLILYHRQLQITSEKWRLHIIPDENKNKIVFEFKDFPKTGKVECEKILILLLSHFLTTELCWELLMENVGPLEIRRSGIKQTLLVKIFLLKLERFPYKRWHQPEKLFKTNKYF